MAKQPRDLKKAPPRTQDYIKLLRRKSGTTAEDLKAMALDKYGTSGADLTKHNHYSLNLLAKTYGFHCYSQKNEGELMRYQFVRQDEPTTAFDPNVKWDGKKTVHVDEGAKRHAAARVRTERKSAKSE